MWKFFGSAKPDKFAQAKVNADAAKAWEALIAYYKTEADRKQVFDRLAKLDELAKEIMIAVLRNDSSWLSNMEIPETQIDAAKLFYVMAEAMIQEHDDRFERLNKSCNQ